MMISCSQCGMSFDVPGRGHGYSACMNHRRRISVKCERVVMGQLQPGDMYSVAGPEYWDDAADLSAHGLVQVRFNYRWIGDDNELTWRLTFETKQAADSIDA